jgi:redox-sensitive bicupin YhaK (pirin superfamily)
MTAGSGIIHQEMPKQENALLWGFQLWVNLPASHKMMPPRYRGITSDQIPEVSLSNDVSVKVVCGTVAGVTGPVQDIIVDPEYLDVSVPAGTIFEHQVKHDYTVCAYVLEGRGYFDDKKTQLLDAENLVLFKKGDQVTIVTEDEPVHFLLFSGKPLGEPVAWRGPIVMNTQQELGVAFQEYQAGTFIKHQ